MNELRRHVKRKETQSIFAHLCTSVTLAFKPVQQFKNRNDRSRVAQPMNEMRRKDVEERTNSGIIKKLLAVVWSY